MIKRVLAIVLLISCSHSYSQTSIGLNTGYARTNYYDGFNLELVFKQKKNKHHFQGALGSYFLGEKLKPTLSSHFQFGSQIFRNTKRLFWVNELNVIYGTKFNTHDFRPLMANGGPGLSCYTARMALTINSGLEFQIIRKSKINLFVDLKIGLGKAFIIEEIEHYLIDPDTLPPCEPGHNYILRRNLGFLLTYNLKS